MGFVAEVAVSAGTVDDGEVRIGGEEVDVVFGEVVAVDDDGVRGAGELAEVVEDGTRAIVKCGIPGTEGL